VSQSHLTNPRWGFPHSRVCAPPREGRGPGKEKRGGAGWVPRRRRRAAAGECRGREEPDEGEAVPDNRGAEPEKDTAVNTEDMPPTSSSMQRLHHRPDVSRSAALTPLAPPSFLVHACGCAFEPS
jgi:hypothetical protein